MIKIVEECLQIANSAVIKTLSTERDALYAKVRLIRGLYGDEGLSEEATAQIGELSKQMEKLTGAENLVCYELNDLRKNAENLIREHDGA